MTKNVLDALGKSALLLNTSELDLSETEIKDKEAFWSFKNSAFLINIK
jgi:hypothetical protein